MEEADSETMVEDDVEESVVATVISPLDTLPRKPITERHQRRRRRVLRRHIIIPTLPILNLLLLHRLHHDHPSGDHGGDGGVEGDLGLLGWGE